MNDFIYNAGQLNSGNLAGNQFLNFSIIALTEMPSCFVGSILITKLGRRWAHVLCMLGSAIPHALIIPLVNSDEPATSFVTGLAITARLSSNVGWYVMWVQAIEIIPTNVRGTGANLASLIANFPVIGVSHLTAVVSIRMTRGRECDQSTFMAFFPGRFDAEAYVCNFRSN